MSVQPIHHLRLLVALPVAAAMLFVAVHLLVTEGDITRVRFVFGTGFLLGLMVVPEADASTFKRPLLIQIPAGCLAGTLLAAYMTTSPVAWLLGSLAGAAIGATTRYWIVLPFGPKTPNNDT